MKKNEDKKDGITKYMTIYMCLGVCFGVSGGMVFGMVFYPGHMVMGMCFGFSVGMAIGMAIGSAKDKKLSENMMKISKIEIRSALSGIIIHVLDKNGAEKEYRVTEKKMREEKFSVDDRVAEESDGSLVSLESR